MRSLRFGGGGGGGGGAGQARLVDLSEYKEEADAAVGDQGDFAGIWVWEADADCGSGGLIRSWKGCDWGWVGFSRGPFRFEGF